MTAPLGPYPEIVSKLRLTYPVCSLLRDEGAGGGDIQKHIHLHTFEGRFRFARDIKQESRAESALPRVFQGRQEDWQRRRFERDRIKSIEQKTPKGSRG